MKQRDTCWNYHGAALENKWLKSLITGGAAIFLGLVLNIPVLRETFRFSLIHPVDVVICISAGILSIVWFELFKAFRGGSG